MGAAKREAPPRKSTYRRQSFFSTTRRVTNIDLLTVLCMYTCTVCTPQWLLRASLPHDRAAWFEAPDGHHLATGIQDAIATARRAAADMQETWRHREISALHVVSS